MWYTHLMVDKMWMSTYTLVSGEKRMFRTKKDAPVGHLCVRLYEVKEISPCHAAWNTMYRLDTAIERYNSIKENYL